MPGAQAKSWPQYHALRREGMAKAMAARIVNAQAKRKPRSLKAKT